jgi:hypothetical protein
MEIKKVLLSQHSITLEDYMWKYIDDKAKEYSKGSVKINKNEVLRAIVREHIDNHIGGE